MTAEYANIEMAANENECMICSAGECAIMEEEERHGIDDGCVLAHLLNVSMLLGV